MNAYDPTARCMCGHNQASHDAQGCMICAAQGQRCDGFWTMQEYQESVRRAQLDLLQAERERRDSQKDKRA